MANRLGGKGKQQVGLALKMARFLFLVWCVVTVLFYYGGGKDEAGKVWNAAYAALQLFFVNVEYESFVKEPGDFWNDLLVAARYMVPWMIPVLAVLAFVDALRVRLILWTRRKLGSLSCGDRPLVLIVGLGVKGLAMVHAERGRSENAHIVVLERDPDNSAIPASKAVGATVWIGDADSEADLALCCWKRPNRIFAMTGSDERNLLVVKIARKLFAETASDQCNPGDSLVEVFALIQDLQERRNASSMEMFNDDTETFWTHLMDYEEDIAAYSLHKYPVLPVGGDAPRVLVVGGGRLGYALTVELLKQGHFMSQDGTKSLPQFVLVDKSGDEIARFEGLKNTLAYAVRNKIEFAELQTGIADVNDWTFDDYCALRREAAFTHVFVALGSELRNFTIAGKLAEWEALARGNLSKDKAVILAYSYEDWVPNNGGASSQAADDRPFKVFHLSEVYSSDALKWREELRETAVRINGCYEMISKNAKSGSIGEASKLDPSWLFDTSEIKAAAGLWWDTNKRDRDASLDLAKHFTIKILSWSVVVDWLPSKRFLRSWQKRSTNAGMQQNYLMAMF